MRATAGRLFQSVHSEIDQQVELPIADNLGTSPLSPPPADTTPELHYSNPIFRTPSIPGSTTGALAASATGATAQFPSAPLIPSLTRSLATFAERSGSHESGGDAAITPASTWWSYSKHKRRISVGQAEGYIRTRSVRPLLSVSFTDTHAL